ncbi:unnamed protein product [Lasius platythorax]|uniref:Uncharacterized protein n=1 Tax=Lasius platythorax TaxID=488582 RepID=A0AAV2NXG8_9HYME
MARVNKGHRNVRHPRRSRARFLSEEDHDHDLSRHTGRCRRHHHRRILRTVNAKTREVQRHQQHRVPNSESPAASAFTHIAPIREADRHSDERRSSLSKMPSSARFYRNTHHR